MSVGRKNAKQARPLGSMMTSSLTSTRAAGPHGLNLRAALDALDSYLWRWHLHVTNRWVRQPVYLENADGSMHLVQMANAMQHRCVYCHIWRMEAHGPCVCRENNVV